MPTSATVSTLYATTPGSTYINTFTNQSAIVALEFRRQPERRIGGELHEQQLRVRDDGGAGNARQRPDLPKRVLLDLLLRGRCPSIAAGGVPCTGGSPGAFTGCVAPSYNNGQSGVVIDGNIILDNGSNGFPGPGGAIECMGPTPLVQNNYVHGWGVVLFAGYMFSYDAATNNYSQPQVEPFYFQNNSACGTTKQQGTAVTDSSGLYDNVDQPSRDLHNISPNGGNNTFSASCATMAPPPLPPQVVVPPDMLDANGGLNALTTNQVPGANTYWANANAQLNDNYP